MIETVIGHAVTSVGKVREHNEDNHLVDTDAGVFAVADGMGGHAAGEVASGIAIRRVASAWRTPTMRRRIEEYATRGDADSRRQLLAAVREGVAAAHAEIVETARADSTKYGMGTTFTGFLIAGGDAIFAHAGDSRAYLVRDGHAIQLSEDHTVVARLEAAGLRGYDVGHDATQWQGVLTNALGIGDDARVVTFVVPIYSGDRFLLCSDGVHDYLTEGEVGKVMVEAPSPARSAQRYVDIALDRGGADNATAVVVKVLEAGETKVPLEQRQRDDAVLEASPFLGVLTPRERLRALRITTPRELEEGRVISPVALGDRVAYLVMDGAADCGEGRVARAGDLLYPESLLEGHAAVESAHAATSVRLLVLRHDDFVELTEDDAEIGVKLYDALHDIIGRAR